MTGPNEANGQGKIHELSALGLLTPDNAQKLRSHWINTVEQFVSAAATEQGCEGLNNLLADTDVTADALLQEARAILGELHFMALMQAKPGGPLGARFDDPSYNPIPDGSKGGNS